jgi:predicted ATPase
LLKSTRQQYHQRIALVLEAQFPETAEAQPELLAHHYTEAGLSVQAIPYWQQAGQQAVERSAYQNMAEDHTCKGVGECHPYREFEGMQPSR